MGYAGSIIFHFMIEPNIICPTLYVSQKKRPALKFVKNTISLQPLYDRNRKRAVAQEVERDRHGQKIGAAAGADAAAHEIGFRRRDCPASLLAENAAAGKNCFRLLLYLPRRRPIRPPKNGAVLDYRHQGQKTVQQRIV